MAEGDNPQGGVNKAEELQKLLNKHNGDAMATLGILFSENYDLREKNRKYKAQLPTEGSVVLSKEDAAQYEQAKSVMQVLSDLKVKPEELKTKLADVAAENAQLKREAMRNALTELGYSSQALADFDALEGKEIESYAAKDEQKDGKTVKVAYVTVGGKERPFDEYAKEKRPALAQILKSDSTAAQGGVTYVNQSAGGRGPVAKTVFDRVREDVKTKEAQKSADLHPMFQRIPGRGAAQTTGE